MGAYAASKAGLIGLAKSLASDHAADGVAINMALPGGSHAAITGVGPRHTSSIRRCIRQDAWLNPKRSRRRHCSCFRTDRDLSPGRQCLWTVIWVVDCADKTAGGGNKFIRSFVRIEEILVDPDVGPMSEQGAAGGKTSGIPDPRPDGDMQGSISGAIWFTLGQSCTRRSPVCPKSISGTRSAAPTRF